MSVRVAVLGQGSAGRRHAADLAALGCEVVTYDPERPPEVGARARTADEAIDAASAVVVATPTILHADQAVAALQAGRAVLVEKPLASTSADAERVLAAAAHADAPCGVAMNLRFHRGVLVLRDLVRSGALGDVVYAAASFGYDLRRWRPGTDYRRSYSARADLGGGIVLDAVHELDILLWLLGPIASVSAETARTAVLEADVEHLAAAVLRTTSGAVATVDVNFVEATYRRGCTVVGSDATAVWDWNGGSVVVRGDGEAATMDAACDVRDTYRAVAEDFVAAVTTGAPVRTPLADGLAAVRLADAIKRSAAAGRRVTLP